MKCIKKEYRITQHRSSIVGLKRESMFVFNFMKNCHNSINKENTADSLSNYKPLCKTEWSLQTLFIVWQVQFCKMCSLTVCKNTVCLHTDLVIF